MVLDADRGRRYSSLGERGLLLGLPLIVISGDKANGPRIGLLTASSDVILIASTA